MRYRNEMRHPFFADDGPTVFCHVLTTPSGRRLLVTANLYGNESTDGEANLNYSVYKPSLLGGRQVRSSSYFDDCFAKAPTADGRPVDFLFYANRIHLGRPDPQDASHFTIEYEAPSGARGTIDGYLDDGGAVQFKARPGPIDLSKYWTSD